MSRGYIKFTNYHVPKILNREKYITVRYGWNDLPELGEVVDLLDGNGDKFGEAEIVAVNNVTIERFVKMDWHGHRSYDSPAHMIERMQDFYDADLTPRTKVASITFNLLD